MAHQRFASSRPVSGILRRGGIRCAGLTLVEVVVSIMLLGIVTGSALFALNMVNHHAVTSRNSTAAMAMAKDTVDEALTIFYSPPENVPAILEPTGNEPRVEEDIPVYISEGDAAQLVFGTRETTVEPVAGTLAGTMRITVRVAYEYRGELFEAEMSTIRAPIN